MAEAIGLAASIATLLEIVAKVSVLSYRYVSDVSNATKTQKAYLDEISALQDVLLLSQKAISDAADNALLPKSPDSLVEIQKEMLECKKNLSALYIDLNNQLKRVFWPFQEKTLAKYTVTIRRSQRILSDFLISNIL